MSDPERYNFSMTKEPQTIQPLEPQGWFRWLHYHAYGGRCRPGFEVATESGICWESAASDSAIVGLHAWEVGRNGRMDLLGKNWHTLTPEQRGAAAAGLSENKEGMKWITPRLESCALDAVATCQLACNAVDHKRTDILAKVLRTSTYLTGEVRRYLGPRGRSWEEFAPVIEQLSNRCIDLILEAAVIRENSPAIQMALEYGANPDIPVWVLHRSFNEKHCALSFCIEHRKKKAVKLLLAAGANPRGITFCTPNLPLFQAISSKDHTLAFRLLKKGASFADSEAGTQRRRTIAKARKKKWISPASDYSFGHLEQNLSWVRENIGSLIKLVPVGRKPCFYDGNGQGGYWSTFLDVAGSDVSVIKRYEALGLDTRLTAEEFMSVLDDNTYEKLLYLLRNESEEVRARVMFRVRRWRPSFGADGPMALRPQDDCVSDAVGFDPGSQAPLILPDGSALFVDFEAIAAPGHPHGPCLEGHFWHLKEKAALRRRGERTIMKRLRSRWQMAEKPDYDYELTKLLPVVRRFEGRFIRLGSSVSGLGFSAHDEEIDSAIRRWKESSAFQNIVEEAKRRIAAQDQSNTRPTAPALTRDELDGYPKEFWPFLVRLPSGFIGMREDVVSPAMFRNYRSWERENKREDSFVPDPRILGHNLWHEVPPELKPYLVWDDMFDRPGFRHGGNTEYDQAMSHKATRWWNNWITPQLLSLIAANEK